MTWKQVECPFEEDRAILHYLHTAPIFSEDGENSFLLCPSKCLLAIVCPCSPIPLTFLFSFFPRTLPRVLREWESGEPGREGQMESTQVRMITHVRWEVTLSASRHTLLHRLFFHLLSGLTFWERHEAPTAANPPTTDGACVLIALKWTVKEPSWYLGVFVQRND